MDIIETTPAENTVDNTVAEDAVTEAPEAVSYRVPGTDKEITLDAAESEDIPAEVAEEPAIAPKEESFHEKHVRNHQNATRRIQNQNARLKAKIAELQARIEKMQPNDPNKELVEHEAETYRTIVDSANEEAFSERAAEAYPDPAEHKLFMDRTYQYSDYVNKHEPEVRKYIGREYGVILLNEWYKRMEDPKDRAEWLQFTNYEKGAILANFYAKIQQVAEHIDDRPAPRPRNIPVARGGRNSNAHIPNDDFGMALQMAEQQFRRR